MLFGVVLTLFAYKRKKVKRLLQIDDGAAVPANGPQGLARSAVYAHRCRARSRPIPEQWRLPPVDLPLRPAGYGQRRERNPYSVVAYLYQNAFFNFLIS